MIFKSLKVVNIVNGYIFVYIFRDKNKTKVEVKGKQITISLSKINLLNQLESGGFKQKERKKERREGREGGREDRREGREEGRKKVFFLSAYLNTIGHHSSLLSIDGI